MAKALVKPRDLSMDDRPPLSESQDQNKAPTPRERPAKEESCVDDVLRFANETPVQNPLESLHFYIMYYRHATLGRYRQRSRPPSNP